MSETQYQRKFIVRTGVLLRLKQLCLVKPSPGKFIRLRRSQNHTGPHEFKVDGQWYPCCIDRDEHGNHIIACLPHHVRPIYKLVAWMSREIDKQIEIKSIIKPTLPSSIFDIIQADIFDFFQAIDDLNTTNGFGNGGFLFTGPPGVGKSETMRWITSIADIKYGRGSARLSLSQLNTMLAEGVEINPNGTLVLIDDIDANLLRNRTLTKNPLTSQFLTCLDGLGKREGRVIIASTNESIDDIDIALLRPGRFDRIINFEYPTDDLIAQYCKQREVSLDFDLFSNWSFARIDMFLNRHKVAAYRFGTSQSVFYEQFVHQYGEEDKTVAAYEELNENSNH